MVKKIMAVLVFFKFLCSCLAAGPGSGAGRTGQKGKSPARKSQREEIKVITNKDLEKLTKTRPIIIPNETVSDTTGSQDNSTAQSQPSITLPHGRSPGNS
jgi:hypothetical protein